MTLIDTDEIFRRVVMVVGAVVVASGVGFTVWYNTKLQTEFLDGKKETVNLRDETARLDLETAVIKNTVSSTARELKSSLQMAAEETKKVDHEVRQQTVSIKQLQQELEKFRQESKIDNTKLREANAAAVASAVATLQDQIKLRDQSLEKYKVEAKNELMSLQSQLQQKNLELADVKNKLDKETDWRNRNFWNR